MQAAGNAVKRATEALVRAAKKLKDGEWDDEDSDVAINQRMVGGIAQVHQIRILQFEAVISPKLIYLYMYFGVTARR